MHIRRHNRAYLVFHRTVFLNALGNFDKMHMLNGKQCITLHKHHLYSPKCTQCFYVIKRQCICYIFFSIRKCIHKILRHSTKKVRFFSLPEFFNVIYLCIQRSVHPVCMCAFGAYCNILQYPIKLLYLFALK